MASANCRSFKGQQFVRCLWILYFERGTSETLVKSAFEYFGMWNFAAKSKMSSLQQVICKQTLNYLTISRKRSFCCTWITAHGPCSV